MDIIDSEELTGEAAGEDAERLRLAVAQDCPRTTFFAGRIDVRRERWSWRLLHDETALAQQQRLAWAGKTMVTLPVRAAARDGRSARRSTLRRSVDQGRSRQQLTMVVGHGQVLHYPPAMPDPVPPATISISEFKATCLAVLERVRVTGQPILVTRRGQPVAEIVPPPVVPSADWIGSMAGTAEIVGDIVGPVVPPETWEVLRD